MSQYDVLSDEVLPAPATENESHNDVEMRSVGDRSFASTAPSRCADGTVDTTVLPMLEHTAGSDEIAGSDASGEAEPTTTSPDLPPFPVKHFIALAMILCTNGVYVSVVFPFLKFYVVDLGVSEKESGTYVGIVAAAFMVGRTVSSVFWGRFADTRGRIPAVVISLVTTVVLSVCFGLPVNVWLSAVIRFVGGSTNCLSGLGKVIASELVPPEQQATAMSIASVSWGSGLIFGPAFGGWLSDFDIDVPYLPPMLFSCAVALTALVLVLKYLPETLKKDARENTSRASTYQLATHGLLLKATLLHCVWSLQSLSNTTLFNTWASTDISIGGLGLSSGDLGTMQSVAGCIMMAMQFFVMPPLCKRFGMKQLTLLCLALYLPLQLTTPLLRFLPGVVHPNETVRAVNETVHNMTSSGSGSEEDFIPVSGAEKAVLLVLLTVVTGCMLTLSNFCFTIQFMFINNSVRAHNRGAAQGIATALASVFKSLGPFVVGVIFSWSVSEERAFPLNFPFAYLCLAVVTCLSLGVTVYLPESLGKPVDEDSGSVI